MAPTYLHRRSPHHLLSSKKTDTDFGTGILYHRDTEVEKPNLAPRFALSASEVRNLLKSDGITSLKDRNQEENQIRMAWPQLSRSPISTVEAVHPIRTKPNNNGASQNLVFFLVDQKWERRSKTAPIIGTLGSITEISALHRSRQALQLKRGGKFHHSSQFRKNQVPTYYTS